MTAIVQRVVFGKGLSMGVAMRMTALLLVLLFNSFIRVLGAQAEAGNSVKLASIDRHSDALHRNFTPMPREQEVSSYVCGAGSGYPSTVCSFARMVTFAVSPTAAITSAARGARSVEAMVSATE